MDKLIQDINTCLLALYEGDKERLKECNIIGLKDQFDTAAKYQVNEYNLLRQALSDLTVDKQEKLKHYISRIKVTENNKGYQLDHFILQDIYDWAKLDKQPYFERYISLIKIKGSSDINPNEITHFRKFLRDQYADTVCDFLTVKIKKGKPTEKAKWIFVLFKLGLFKPEIMNNQASLWAQSSEFKYRDFYKAFQIMTCTEADQETNLKRETKEIFDIWSSKQISPQNSPDLRGYFDELNRLLINHTRGMK
jgi:hypothetical protein